MYYVKLVMITMPGFNGSKMQWNISELNLTLLKIFIRKFCAKADS
jgi:hypothetical protein